MLTPLMEGGRVKCFQYWPSLVGKEEEFENFKVKLISEETNSDNITIRKFQISKDDSSNSLAVTQIQYEDWPDHGSPETSDLFLRLVKMVSDQNPKNEPLVAHCRFHSNISFFLIT